MNQETIISIATEIANQAIMKNWLLHLLIVLLTIVSAAISAFIGAYFAKRGEQRALSADFENIKQQLVESTKISESIKMDIQALSERTERLQWLKRDKLELYFISILESVEYLSKQMFHQFFNTELPIGPDPLSNASMLQKLYLPELDIEHADFLKSVVAFRTWLSDGMEMQAEAMKVGGNKLPPPKSHLDRYRDFLDVVYSKCSALESAAKELSRKLNKV